MTQSAHADRNYQLLTQLRWEGERTQRIEWRRDGDVAYATFGTFEDATWFVHGYLDYDLLGASCFKKEDTAESIRLRGRLREDFLPMRSKVEDIALPKRHPWGVPVTVEIPLDFLIPERLTKLLERETRYFDRKAPAPAPIY